MGSRVACLGALGKIRPGSSLPTASRSQISSTVNTAHSFKGVWQKKIFIIHYEVGGFNLRNEGDLV